jgi:hypothetical protein
MRFYLCTRANQKQSGREAVISFGAKMMMMMVATAENNGGILFGVSKSHFLASIRGSQTRTALYVNIYS